MNQGLPKRCDACAAGILIRYLKILLVKRSASRSFYPNVWDLPGGHLEAGESPEAALVRELREELGIVATAFESLGTFQELSPEGYGWYKYYVYLVTGWRGTVANRQLEGIRRLDGWHLKILVTSTWRILSMRSSFSTLCNVSRRR